MSAKKIITVFGATGAQGGGVVRAITSDPGSEFTARAVTRDPNADKAKELVALGAEVVYGDLSDAASVHKALEGAYGAFFVTFFWAHFSAEQEKAEAALFAKAAKEAGIKHAICVKVVRTFGIFFVAGPLDIAFFLKLLVAHAGIIAGAAFAALLPAFKSLFRRFPFNQGSPVLIFKTHAVSVI